MTLFSPDATCAHFVSKVPSLRECAQPRTIFSHDKWRNTAAVLSFRLYRITVIFQVVKIEGYTIVKITNEKVQLIPEGGNRKVSIQKVLHFSIL